MSPPHRPHHIPRLQHSQQIPSQPKPPIATNTPITTSSTPLPTNNPNGPNTRKDESVIGPFDDKAFGLNRSNVDSQVGPLDDFDSPEGPLDDFSLDLNEDNPHLVEDGIVFKIDKTTGDGVPIDVNDSNYSVSDGYLFFNNNPVINVVNKDKILVKIKDYEGMTLYAEQKN